MSYNSWAYTYGNPVNALDPSGLCIYCGIGERVRVDAREFNHPEADETWDSTEAGALHTLPSSFSPVSDQLADLQSVIVMSSAQYNGAPSSNPDAAWRRVLVTTAAMPFPHSGWVRNRVLLDNCSGFPGGFGCLPIDMRPVYQTFGFGPNKYAEAHGETAYDALRGLHNGLDFSAPVGTALIWAGTGEGEVVAHPRDALIAFGVDYAGMKVVYGHVDRIDYDIGYHVRPGQVIGLSGNPVDREGNEIPDAHHLHFGLRRGDTIHINPLYYFPGGLQDKIAALMIGSGHYNHGLDPWSMYSFDAQYSNWYWDCDDVNSLLGIVWSGNSRAPE